MPSPRTTTNSMQMMWNRAKQRSVLTVLASLLLMSASPSPAQEAPPADHLEPLIVQAPRIDTLVSYAYLHNPAIVEAREAWRAKVESYRVATGLPDPQLMVTYFPEPIETRLGPQDWNATLSQAIPFPGKLIKAGDVVETEAAIAKLRLDKTVRDVATGIREAAYELAYIRQARQITAQNMQLLNHLRRIAETAFTQEQAALLDVVKAQSQTGQLRYDALLLEELEQTERTRLNGLLNRPPEAAVGPLTLPDPQPLRHRLEEIYQLAETYQEEIRIAELEVTRSEARVDLARYQYAPDFKVGLFYAWIGDPDVPEDPPDASDDAVGVQFGVSIPLWFGQKQGRVNQARAEQARAEAARRSRINDTNTQIHATYFRLENARRLVELYQTELLPQAAQSMETAETWYKQGQSSFSDFVEAQAVWYNFTLSLARARADYGKFWAQLERLVGQSLVGNPSAAGSKETPP